MRRLFTGPSQVKLGVAKPPTHSREGSANRHKLARLTPMGRLRMIRRFAAGERLRDVAAAIDLRTTSVRRWWRRYQHDGPAGLADRSSRPHHSPRAADRQRQRRCRASVSRRLPAPRDPPSADASLLAADQRQRGTLHPDLLAGMGVRAIVSHLHCAGTRAPGFRTIRQRGSIPPGAQRAHSHAATCDASVNNVFINNT